MGAVYEAEHVETGARVALKRILPDLLRGLDAEALDRFRREAQLSARLSHPGIVPVHAAELEVPEPYFVQALFPGGTLEARVREQGPLSAPEARHLGARLADALAYAHAAGVIHRDLKPANVLFDERGEPAIADFGLATARGDADRLTRTGELLGTPAYMPPEQIEDARRVDPRADVYALGAVLYFALSGQPPFAGQGVYGVLQRVLAGSPAPLGERVPGLPPALVAQVERALAKEPGARFPDATALAAALRDADPVGMKRGPAWALAALAGAVGIALVAAWALSRPAQPAVVRPSPALPTPAAPEPPAALLEAAAALRAGDLGRAQERLHAWGGAQPGDEQALSLCRALDAKEREWVSSLGRTTWRVSDLIEQTSRAVALLPAGTQEVLRLAAQRRALRAAAVWLCAASRQTLEVGERELRAFVAEAEGDPDRLLALRAAWVWQTSDLDPRPPSGNDWERERARWGSLPVCDWSSWRELDPWERVWTALAVGEIPLEHLPPGLERELVLEQLEAAVEGFPAGDAPLRLRDKASELWRRLLQRTRETFDLMQPELAAKQAARIAELEQLLPSVDENRFEHAVSCMFSADPARLRAAAKQLQGENTGEHRTAAYLEAEALLLEGRLAEALRVVEDLIHPGSRYVKSSQEEELALYWHLCHLLGRPYDVPTEIERAAQPGRSWMGWRTVAYTRRILTEGAWWPGRGVAPDPR